MRPAHDRDDEGFTLIEALVAIVLIGVGVVGVLGMLQFTMGVAGGQRDLANAEVALRNAAERIKAAPYDSTFGSYNDVPGVSITQWQCWAGPDEPNLFVGSSFCPAGPQKMTLVSAASNEVRTDIVKRADG